MGVADAEGGPEPGQAKEDGPRTPDGRLRLPWLDPNDRIWAVAVPHRGVDGQHRVPRDRRGRLKIDKVDLLRAAPPQGDPPPQASPGTSGLDRPRERWLLDADSRSWAAVTSAFGTESLRTALHLIDRGAIELRVPVSHATLRLDHPLRWQLTDEWRLLASESKRLRTERRSRAADEARAAADMVDQLDPGLTHALRSGPDHRPLLPVLVAAAHDLAQGVRHDGPRAFSQAHFGDGKLRENAPIILRRAGVSEETIDLLGLRRSPYVGLGGPMMVNGLMLSDLSGPVRFRADLHHPLSTEFHPSATHLLLIENLQAAEAICDTLPDVATVWFAGQPADAVLHVCLALTRRAASLGLPVLLAPDADLGGAHIANRLVEGILSDVALEIIDVGGVAHPAGDAFSERTLSDLDRLRRRAEQGGSGPHSTALASFVTAVLNRGYAVEQEATIRRAVEHVLAP